MNTPRLYPRHGRFQLLFLLGLGAFLLFLITTAFLRSSNRGSLLSSGKQSIPESLLGGAGNGREEASEVHLQEFHRVEVKEGKPAWEIHAREARFFPDQKLTHVNDASLTIYRAKNSFVGMRSKAAKLFMNGTSLSKADLEGDVVVSIDDSVFTQTDFATYDVQTGLVKAPGHVSINGSGFEIKGTGLEAIVENHEMTLQDNVTSRFDSWADVPEGVSGIMDGGEER